MLNIHKISAVSLDEAIVQMQALDAQWIDHVNWPEQFPASPKVAVKVAHNGRMLFLHFHVDEEVTMAQVAQDNGRVWTDSAVEFFVTFDERGYYNFEFTCTGRALLGFRRTKPEAIHADGDTMRSILRRASLGPELFAERHIPGGWNLTVGIPVSAFFAHDIKHLDGLRARGNFYKCGDDLSKPHFLSWAPIHTPNPNFHVPECFGELLFEP